MVLPSYKFLFNLPDNCTSEADSRYLEHSKKLDTLSALNFMIVLMPKLMPKLNDHQN